MLVTCKLLNAKRILSQTSIWDSKTNSSRLQPYKWQKHLIEMINDRIQMEIKLLTCCPQIILDRESKARVFNK